MHPASKTPGTAIGGWSRAGILRSQQTNKLDEQISVWARKSLVPCC